MCDLTRRIVRGLRPGAVVVFVGLLAPWGCGKGGKDEKLSLWARTKKYFREVRAELKKVAWPSTHHVGPRSDFMAYWWKCVSSWTTVERASAPAP